MRYVLLVFWCTRADFKNRLLLFCSDFPGASGDTKIFAKLPTFRFVAGF